MEKPKNYPTSGQNRNNKRVSKHEMRRHAILQSSQIEECLHEKTQLNQILLDAFPCAALLLRPSSREIVASNRFAKQAGAVPGKQCFSTWGKRENPCPWCLAPSLWATGKAQHLEVEAFGTVWDAHWIPVDEDLYMHYAFDITERKKTEQALKESEEKYRHLFENLLNGFAYCKMILDEKGEPSDFTYLQVNDAFEKMTGHTKSQIIGKNVSDVFPDIRESIPEMLEACGRAALTGKTGHVEINLEPRDVWLSISVYSPKEGYFAAIFEDITEQKKAEKKLQEYSEGLEFTVAERTQELKDSSERLLKAERFAAIGELAGMVGHDLRNPLTAIKNAVYYLDRKQGTTMDPKTKEMFKIIDKSVEHANKIIGNLLEYSKEIRLEIEECTPKSLIDYILLMIQIPDHVKILDRTQDAPVMWVDTNKIERVFINLIKNAIDAMPQKGTLEIRSQQKGENVEFTFTDTGMGMTEQTKAKIFTPLFTTKAQGMGFGLAICRRIVETHNGKIDVESNLGKGTTFTITLPVEQEIKIVHEEQTLGLQEQVLADSKSDHN